LNQTFNGFGHFCGAEGPAKMTNYVSPDKKSCCHAMGGGKIALIFIGMTIAQKTQMEWVGNVPGSDS
jgi:hypothetical protein